MFAAFLSLLSLLPLAAASPSLEVISDPEVDLVATIWYLASPGGERGFGGRATPASFVEAVKELKGERHAAVKLAAKMAEKGFAFDAPVAWALRVDASGSPTQALPADLVQRAGGQKNLDKLTVAVQDFRKATRFDEWHARHQGEWDAWQAQVSRGLAGRDLPADLEAWYGRGAASYSLVVSPALGARPFATWIQDPTGLHLYGVLAPSTPELASAALWTLGDALLSPVLEQAWASFVVTERMFGPIAQPMAEHGHVTWRRALAATLARAAVCRMDTERFGAIEGLECVAEQVHDGFAYTPLAYDAYDRYRADKEKFPGFDAFLLELAGLYGSILSPESWIRKSPWAGALSIDDVRASTTLNSTLVVPTVYEDEDLERRINAHIRALAPSMTSGRVSWDTDALPVPPENGAWVLFGGPANNVVLSRWAESFPFQVTPDAIEVDGRRFEGTDLRLIAALPNPSGLGPTGVPKGGAGWIVYTAQRDADILGVETVPNGRTAWVLARGQEVLAEGFFLPESVRRALPPPPTPPEARP